MKKKALKLIIYTFKHEKGKHISFNLLLTILTMDNIVYHWLHMVFSPRF